jgi:hypothetical protein
MQDLVSRRFGRALLVVALLALGLNTLASTFSASPESVALASVAAGGDNDEDNDQNESEEDRTIEGGVIRIHKDRNPPELILGNIDGEVTVRMLKTDEIDIHGVQVNDYLSIDGEKIHEFLFEGTTIEKR